MPAAQLHSSPASIRRTLAKKVNSQKRTLVHDGQGVDQTAAFEPSGHQNE